MNLVGTALKNEDSLIFYKTPSVRGFHAFSMAFFSGFLIFREADYSIATFIYPRLYFSGREA